LNEDVNTPSRAYDIAQPARDEAQTLMGGTAAMREAGVKYLPKNERESDKKYKARLGRSFLYNVFLNTITSMSGKPFEKPATVQPVDEFYETFLKDVDKQGVGIDAFGQDLLKQVLAKGLTFILVDMPPVKLEEGKTLSRQDEIDQGIRPYWAHIHADNLIAWDVEVINGVKMLSRIRIREEVSEKSGDFGETWHKQVRVITRDSWQTYRPKSENSTEWVLHDEGVRTAGVVTLVQVQADKAVFMQSEPPLKPLAEKNIEHWQSSSDQRNILHVSRVPLLFAREIDLPEDEQGKPTGEISTGSIVTSSSEHGDLKWVELSGEGSIVQGKADVDRLVDEMESLGGQLMLRKTGDNPTATEDNHKEAKGNSVLHSILTNLESALDLALKYTQALRGVAGDAPMVSLYKDFSIQNPNYLKADDLLKARVASQISGPTYWDNMIALGLKSDHTWEDEQDAIGEDAANLPAVTDADDE
jgi:hypothetical protein